MLKHIEAPPPNDGDLEEAVLGAIILEKVGREERIDLLTEDDFYKEKHKELFRAIVDLHKDESPIDMCTVAFQLKKKGTAEKAGGAFAIAELTSKVSSASNAIFHVRLLQEMRIKRQMMALAEKIKELASSDETDAFNTLEKLTEETEKITKSIQSGAFKSAKQLAEEGFSAMLDNHKNKNFRKGISSHIHALDAATSGFKKGELTIIAARPGMGKTAFAGSLMKNASLSGHPTAFFSLEMKAQEVINRMLSDLSNIETKILRKGELTNEIIDKAKDGYSKIAELPFYIDDTPGLSLDEFKARARKIVREKKVEMIVIDYLQLMKGKRNPNGNREQEISGISRGLKKIAKELDVPIVALSQLSRDVEKRGGVKKPMLSDLRESGAIEQDADVVMFLYSPEHYKIFNLENGESTKNYLEVIIAKNRHGKTDVVPVRLSLDYMRLSDWWDNYSEEKAEPPIAKEAAKKALPAGFVPNPNYKPNGNNGDAVYDLADSRFWDKEEDDADKPFIKNPF